MARSVSFGGGLAEAPEPRYMRQRAMADALLQGTNRPVTGIGEGISQLANTAAAGFIGKRADEAEKSTARARAEALRSALASDDPMGALSQSEDPELMNLSLQYQMARAMKDPAETYATLTDDQEKELGLDPSGTYQRGNIGNKVDVLTQPTKPAESPGAVREYEYAKGQGYTGSFLDFQLEQKKAGASTSTTNVTVAGDKKNAETVGDYWGKKLSSVLDAGFSAPVTIAKYKRLGALLDQVGTGTFAQAGVSFKKALKGAGFDPEEFGITDNTAAADAAEAVSNELAMQMRNPSNGAGMPGAMSDSDRNFLSNTVPNLSKVPGGNAVIIDAAVKLAQRDAEVGQMANDYAAARGGLLDGGFYAQLQQWSEANPLFAGMNAPTAPAAGAAGPESAPTATGPNGQKLILRNGQWEPM